MPISRSVPPVELVPVAADDEDWVCALLWQADVRRFLCDDLLLPREEVRASLAASLDPSSATDYWRVVDGGGAAVGLVGLLAPSLAANRLRPIGWRSRELLVALDSAAWGKGLASAAVDAVAAEAGVDGVTFALVACVDEPNLRSHALMRRCGFEELGRADGPKHPLVVYERAV